jgi:Tol biopolymer transport system component
MPSRLSTPSRAMSANLAASSGSTRFPFDDLALYVLDAGGDSTRLPGTPDWGTGSISPDGSTVVYAHTTQHGNQEWRSGLYVVDTDGGQSRLLLAAGRRTYPDDEGQPVSFATGLGSPAFSPDGTQIAYFDGMGDWGNSLWVMNADGSGSRAVIDCRSNPACPNEGAFGHYNSLVWSPDGDHLAFNEARGWIVDVDGSGLMMLAGRDAKWSPVERSRAAPSVYAIAIRRQHSTTRSCAKNLPGETGWPSASAPHRGQPCRS